MKFQKGDRVKDWKGKTGTVIGLDSNPKNKPVIVELDEEKISIRGEKHKAAYYHYNQISKQK